MTENDKLKTCRACAKDEYIFCDTDHETICKLLHFIPSLVRKFQIQINRNCKQNFFVIIFLD